MDGKFLELARAATAGSSQVRPIGELPDYSRVRSFSRSQDDELAPVVRLQLVDDDGVLEWEDVSGMPPDLGRFRSATPTKTPTECEAFEMEFQRLPPSKITQFLSGRDDKLTPHRGLRRLNTETGKLEAAPFPNNGDALVFVHGTFSNSENMLAGLLDKENLIGNEFLEQAAKRFGENLYAFDHPTLAVSPILNAFDLQRAMGRSDAKIRVVSHSRGGLVSRWWCETFDQSGDRCDRVVFVGSPLAGTGLAAPPNIRDTIHLLTQFSRALQYASGMAAIAIPVFSVVEAMLRVVTSITSLGARTPVVDAAMAMVPGLFGMSRVGNNPELRRLLETASMHTERYYAVCSDFQPSDPGWKFWRMFRKDQLIDSAADLLFDGANDLVVDTPSMNDLADDVAIDSKRVLDFRQSPMVHHLNYFYQPETAKFLADALL
ncbi:MAG: hypothetical protein KDB00_05025 [Planctomycetales bacterium]|nr:hypothetical protein [Planctomycetales bacterium]